VKEKQVRLNINGLYLHERFSRLVLDALARLEKLEDLPPIPKGYVRFEASDKSVHEIPRKEMARARRIDPGLIPWNKGLPRFRKDEAELFRTLRFVMVTL
jgi:hypothetical protein